MEMVLKIVLYALLVLLAVGLVGLVVTGTDLYNMMPYVFNREAWKAWKACWNGTACPLDPSDVLSDEDRRETHMRYRFSDAPYVANVVLIDGAYKYTAIFTEDMGLCVMSPFWRYHTDKLYFSKLKAVPVIQQDQ